MSDFQFGVLIASLILVPIYVGLGQYVARARHCRARGFEEYVVSDSGEITCVKVTKTTEGQ